MACLIQWISFFERLSRSRPPEAIIAVRNFVGVFVIEQFCRLWKDVILSLKLVVGKGWGYGGYLVPKLDRVWTLVLKGSQSAFPLWVPNSLLGAVCVTCTLLLNLIIIPLLWIWLFGREQVTRGRVSLLVKNILELLVHALAQDEILAWVQQWDFNRPVNHRTFVIWRSHVKIINFFFARIYHNCLLLSSFRCHLATMRLITFTICQIRQERLIQQAKIMWILHLVDGRHLISLGCTVV